MGYLRRLHTRVLEYARLLLAEHRQPQRVAAAIVCGCIVGCLPLFGLHFFICIGVSRLLRLNLPIMYGAANVSIPPLVPFLGWGSVQLGERLLHGRFLTLSRIEFTGAALPQLVTRFFLSWMTGGALLGAALGVLLSGIVYVILRRRSKGKEKQTAPDDAVSAAIERAAQRYRQTPRRFRYYAAAKYRMDPCYRALLLRIPEGAQVVDLGCGLGMLGVALAELGGGRRSLGIDWDEGKLQAGQTAAGDLATLRLQRGDLRTAELPACDAVALVDVLHYYDPQTQTAILKRAAAALRPGGRLFIRETDPERAGGARLTRIFERMMVLFGWNRGPKVHYLPIPELDRQLRAIGLTAEQVEVAGATHPGNVLLSAGR